MSKRPYRLWDPQTGSYRRWRCYAIALNAHDGAMKEAHHKLKVGQSLEVINHDTGRLLCTYTRSASKGVTWR
jgi:hypothetical protein